MRTRFTLPKPAQTRYGTFKFPTIRPLLSPEMLKRTPALPRALALQHGFTLRWARGGTVRTSGLRIVETSVFDVLSLPHARSQRLSERRDSREQRTDLDLPFALSTLKRSGVMARIST